MMSSPPFKDILPRAPPYMHERFVQQERKKPEGRYEHGHAPATLTRQKENLPIPQRDGIASLPVNHTIIFRHDHTGLPT